MEESKVMGLIVFEAVLRSSCQGGWSILSILRRRLLEFVEDIPVGELKLGGAGADWDVVLHSGL